MLLSWQSIAGRKCGERYEPMRWKSSKHCAIATALRVPKEQEYRILYLCAQNFRKRTGDRVPWDHGILEGKAWTDDLRRAS